MIISKSLFVLILALFSCNNQHKQNVYVIEPISGLEFTHIKSGSFYMGNPDSSIDTLADAKLHKVIISKDFWLSRTEVTLAQWQKVMGSKELHPEKPNPFRNEDPNYPVVSVSYYDVQNFLRKLEELSPGYKFRLPTEAEWEYACRAETTTNFSFGDMLSENVACVNAEYLSEFSNKGNKSMHPKSVGSYAPNQWGLYDMHGNVWEWVSDWYVPFDSLEQVDPQGPINGTEKVIRGGSWYFSADNARSSYRRTHEPSLWGFLLDLELFVKKKKINIPCPRYNEFSLNFQFKNFL